MSLSTSVQKYQLLRIVDPDGSVTNDDKFAFLGIAEATSFELTSAQKKQLLRLAVPDGTVTTSDKFAFLGYMEAQNPGGNIIEQFNVDWYIDTTLTGTLLPTSNDGDFVVVLETVHAGLIGRVDNPPVPETPDEEITGGGFAGINQYLSWEQREKKRKKDARKRYKKPRWVLGPNGWTRADN